MKKCPNCGFDLRPLSPNERAYNRNWPEYQDWLKCIPPLMRSEAVRFTVGLFILAGVQQGTAYRRIKIMIRHGLIRLVKRGARGGGRMSPGTTKNTASIYCLTKKGVELLCR